MSESTPAREPTADEEQTPSIVNTTATLAWATSAFAFSVGGVRWASPQGDFVDAVLCLVVGGGAAYLALALRRQVPYALEASQRIAFAAGVANGVMLPLAIAACSRGVTLGLWPEHKATASQVALGAAVALLATATPWGVYRSLRTKRVQRWFRAGESAAG